MAQKPYRHSHICEMPQGYSFECTPVYYLPNGIAEVRVGITGRKRRHVPTRNVRELQPGDAATHVY